MPGRLKAELEKVALGEGRSLAQVCEVFLTKALEASKEEGSKYVQRFFARFFVHVLISPELIERVVQFVPRCWRGNPMSPLDSV